jgi:hypothetical protein
MPIKIPFDIPLNVLVLAFSISYIVSHDNNFVCS